MSIGLVTANNLPSVYDRKALEDEEMMLISAGRTKLKVPFDTFAAVSNALAIFAPDGKPTMEPGRTITLKDEFSGASTSITASTLLSVMQALAAFSVKKGVYIPKIPPIEEPELVVQTKASAKKLGRTKTTAVETAASAPVIEEVPAAEAPRSRRKAKAVADNTVEETPANEATSETPKPFRKKSGRVAKGGQAEVISQAAVESEINQTIPPSIAKKPRKIPAAKLQKTLAPEVIAKTPEEPVAPSTRKPGRPKASPVVANIDADVGETLPEVIAKNPGVEQTVAKTKPEKKSRKTKEIETVGAPTAAKTVSGGSGEPLTVPDYEGGLLAKALVPDHTKPEAPVKGEGIPSYMADYKMAYILDGGKFRFDFTPLQINPKSKRKVLGVPTDPKAATVPGYEIKSDGEHVGWIIVEEKMLFALGLPNSRDGNQAASNGSVDGIIRKILFGVVPVVDKIRKAA